MGGVIMGFWQKIEELEANLVPNTPLEVFEQRNKEVEEAIIKNIKYCEANCAHLYEETL